jgi:hypothetical protein
MSDPDRIMDLSDATATGTIQATPNQFATRDRDKSTKQKGPLWRATTAADPSIASDIHSHLGRRQAA